MENKDLLTHITDPKVIHEAGMASNEAQRKVMEDQKGWEVDLK